MEEATKLAVWAGPIALAAFAGVFLGGLALSFFWKSFGPWQLLKETKLELEKCQEHRQEELRARAKLEASMADLLARYNILAEAVAAAGLSLTLKLR